MANEKNIKFLERLNPLQHSNDVQETWNALEQVIMDHTRTKYLERIDSSDVGSTFNDWWNSCFELLQPRQIVISDVKFDSTKSDEKKDVYIELHNTGPGIVDLSGWSIQGGNQHMTFINEQLLMPYTKTRIYTDHTMLKKLDNGKPLWNKAGDRVLLNDGKADLISSWCFGDKAHSSVSISHIFFDGKEKYTEADEYAVLINVGNSWVDLSNWQLNAGKNQQFTFPEYALLKPGGSIRVYTNYIDDNTGGYSFNSKTAIWNNRGDVGRLTDHRGCLVFEYRYGDKLVNANKSN
jgi:hypothetical protein